MFVLAAFAILLFALLTLAERRALPWVHRQRDIQPDDSPMFNANALRARTSRLPAALARCGGRLLAGVALAGCGEVKNTIHPSAGTANNVTVELAGQPNAFYVGLYEAQALGLLQADRHERQHRGADRRPGPGDDGPRRPGAGRGLVRADGAAAPQRRTSRWSASPRSCTGRCRPITIPVPKRRTLGRQRGRRQARPRRRPRPRRPRRQRQPRPRRRHGTTTPATTTTTTPARPPRRRADDHHDHRAGLDDLAGGSCSELLSKPGAPTYDGLVLVVRKGSIVDHAGCCAGSSRRWPAVTVRRARTRRGGQQPDHRGPVTRPQKALQRRDRQGRDAVLLPRRPQGLGLAARGAVEPVRHLDDCNHNLLSNPNAITDASTNELLQGQGV